MMMGYLEERIAKLPDYVKRHISKLEADVEHYKNESLAVAGAEGTSICIQGYGQNKNRYLPDGTKITFLLANKEVIEVQIGEKNDTLRCYSHKGRLAFLSECTNVGAIKPIDY